MYQISRNTQAAWRDIGRYRPRLILAEQLGCGSLAERMNFVGPLEAALPNARRPAAKRLGLSHRPHASQALGILQFVFCRTSPAQKFAHRAVTD